MNDNKESQSNDKITNNPKEDIEALDQNLGNAQLQHTLAAEELGYQRSIVKAIKPFWGSVELSNDSPPVLNSGAVFISDWRRQSQVWNEQSEHQFDNITFASSTASTVAANTISIQSAFEYQPAVDVKQLSDILLKRDERTFVEHGLSLIDVTLSNSYRTAWQYLHLPAFDPMRGPLFLMRQVFDHLLEKLAPNGEVSSQLDFIRDEKLFARDGKGITKAHRVQFAANNRIKDPIKRKLVVDSTQNFLDIYQELNMAHGRKDLNVDSARNAVFAASKLIAEWLQALDLK